MNWRSCRQSPGGGSFADPFATNPIRRSFALVTLCAAVVFGPFLVSPRFAETVMISVGWLAMSGLVIGVPILLWSVAEQIVARALRRHRPPVESLPLSPRLAHILRRHGFESVVSVDVVPDEALLMLSNMDWRGVREIRRAISVWKYRRWQERGFPAMGA